MNEECPREQWIDVPVDSIVEIATDNQYRKNANGYAVHATQGWVLGKIDAPLGI